MKGTPETPQCGFSRASIQILGLQGVDPAKFTAFNVLEDQDLRQGTLHIFTYFILKLPIGWNREMKGWRKHGLMRRHRDQRILRLANDTAVVRGEGICGWLRYLGCHASERRTGEAVGGEESAGSCRARGACEFIRGRDKRVVIILYQQVFTQRNSGCAYLLGVMLFSCADGFGRS
jgi:hypothetical protein